jgi:L-threonylcarbamoyladenylate synthase
MRIIDKTEFYAYKNIHLGKIKQGSLFSYPTDTIYGIGCDATNGDAIAKIRELKEREDQPFSIIAPSRDWIQENCIITPEAEKWLQKLPGPYTFVLELKTKEVIHELVNPQDNTVGVRIPNHWISEIAAELGRPIITTSPNKHGLDIMTHPDNLDVEFRAYVEFLIYEGMLHNPPSTVVKLTDSEKPVFLRGQELIAVR